MSAPMPASSVMSLEEVEEQMGCSRRRVFQLLAEGVLERAPRFGRRVRIYAFSVERALLPAPTSSRARRRRKAQPPVWTRADLADLLG